MYIFIGYIIILVQVASKNDFFFLGVCVCVCVELKQGSLGVVQEEKHSVASESTVKKEWKKKKISLSSSKSLF